MKRFFTYVTFAVLLMWAGGSQAESSPGISEHVKIDNFSFNPQTFKVKAGATVTWINKDDVPHTVVSSAKVFRSRVLDTDEKFSYTFTQPGSYDYFCSVHPHMTGKVIVK